MLHGTKYLLVLPALMLVACGAGGNLLVPFEARCAQLPAPRFEVVEVPLTYVEDATQTIDELTVKGGDTPQTHLTFGLTTGNFGHQTEFELRSVDDTGGKRACGTPSVRVELSMQPVVVYLARELAGSGCPSAATFAHEMKHVAVFRQTLHDAVRDMQTDLPAKLGNGVRRASSQPELEQQFRGAVTGYLSAFIRRWHAVLTERHVAIDNPQEYGQVRQACP